MLVGSFAYYEFFKLVKAGVCTDPPKSPFSLLDAIAFYIVF
jgi:hypothetical protein